MTTRPAPLVTLERPSWARHARWAIAVPVVVLAGAAAASHPDLPIGIVAEPTLVAVTLRWSAVLWAVALLLFGARIERATIVTLAMIVGAGLGWAVAAEQSVLLAMACAPAVVAVGMAVYLWLPRLAMAAAMAWPFPALYLAHLWFSGSFDFSKSRAAALVALGVFVGAVAPRGSLPLLSAALGTVLLLGAAPVEPSMTWTLGLATGSVLWQVVARRAWRPHERPAVDGASAPTKGRLWCRSVACAGTVAVAILLWVAVAAPVYGPEEIPDPSRMDRLVRDGELHRPGLVILAPNNLYLSGWSFPVAIATGRASPATRPLFPFVGRNLTGAVRGLRVVKGEAELEAVRRAARITSLAFQDIRPLIRPGVSEAEIERRIVQSYVEHGATGVAFKSIVGSGANAVLPHYDANTAVMNDGLVVIDIGCSFDGYASDMTRTFSVTGEYTAAQKQLIETVIEAGDAARRTLGPGVTMGQVGRAAREVIDAAGFGPYLSHAIGHHVGLQVHHPRRDPLEPGMVVTIEPGIYIPDGADADPSFWNLGVRIEDSYIVTDSGWEEITDYPRRPYAR